MVCWYSNKLNMNNDYWSALNLKAEKIDQTVNFYLNTIGTLRLQL